MAGFREKVKSKFRERKTGNSQEEKERAFERDRLNTEAMISHAVQVDEHSVKDLNMCDFIIARIVWDKQKNKYHDHFAFIKEKGLDGLEVIYVSDIMRGSPQNATWTFEQLSSNINNGQLELTKLDFMNLQDEDNLILARAESFEIPKREVRPLHFAYICAFGAKEPVFSEDHLSLCDEKTLLLLRTDEDDTCLLLHEVEETEEKKFHISFKESDSDVKILSFVELVNLKESQMAALYYYPGVHIESLEKLYNESKKRQVVGSTSEEIGKAVGVEMIKEGLSKGLLLAPELALKVGGVAGKAVTFGLVETVIGVTDASISTHKARGKAREYVDNGGLKGFSRTKRNKEVASTWSGAVAGTAASVGAAAFVGQVLIPVPGVGAMMGAAAGGIVGGLLASYASKKTSNAIFDAHTNNKCPLCQSNK